MKKKYLIKSILTLCVILFVAALNRKYRFSNVPTNSISPLALKGSKAFFAKASLSNPILPKKQSKTPTPDDLKQTDWYAEAIKQIENREYHFTKGDATHGYSTANRSNNLRFHYTENAFSVEPRITKIPQGNYDANTPEKDKKYTEIANWNIAFNIDKQQIDNGKWNINNNKAEYATKDVTVQYINDENGMRQNFIVQNPLPKQDTLSNNLTLNFSVKTVLECKLSDNALQFYHNTDNVMNYQDLKVWDANKQPLQAHFVAQNNDDSTETKQYAIVVNTENAAYPITIDPISTTPNTTLLPGSLYGHFGSSVASAGDVNGDGYSDVIVGANYFDNGQAREGAVYIYHGSATGIGTSANVVIEGNQTLAYFGTSVASAGDVNGDGYSDVIVGANQYSNGNTNEGAAFVYHGSASGIIPTAVTILESNQSFSTYGSAVACAGDVNGDGYSDVIIGARSFSSEGAAFVYHGSASGIISVPVITLSVNQFVAYFGCSVASAGDINGDGYSDIVVGARLYDNGQTDEGAAFVYYGSSTGIVPTSTLLECNQADASFGHSVASAGDVNGDGYSDLIVGAFLYDTLNPNTGRAAIYHGAATGINTTAATFLQNFQNPANFGFSVASAGDINGDGYGDVVVGIPFSNVANPTAGAADVYYGSSTGIQTTFATNLYGPTQFGQFGFSAASAGDVNGDGYSDLIVGAWQRNNETGASYVYHGSAKGADAIADASRESHQVNAQMGISVSSAGDVNGDGYGDVIVGAYLYDNGQNDEGAAFVYHGSATGIAAFATLLECNIAGANFGHSVSTAGDVNGDGYGDVVVGAYNYTNGQTNEGAIFIYHGSASGINTTAAALFDINQAFANFGVSVACAGDVDGDGYSDVIAGARLYDLGQNDEGAVLVFHGSASGLGSVATFLQSNQADAYMGSSVSGAGDVNGDGFGDVIIGAPNFDNGEVDEGVAFVHYGGPLGVLSSGVMLEKNQANAFVGIAVSGAGDINGDGYGDVIVGAYQYDNGQNNEGAAFVHYGSATGIATTGTMLEKDQADAQFGSAVTNAGDVNGDGYADITIAANLYDNGEANEGVVWVYHGSSTGINTVAATLLEANQANATFGNAIASAGDVNGDGFSDIIIGAFKYSNGESEEGTAFMYHGNEANGKRNNLRLFNTDLSTPISNANFGLPNFGAGLFAKSFIGRDKGKLVWETRLNYNPYSGTPITNSILSTAQQSTYTDLGVNGAELKNLITKVNGGRYTKIRARVKYNPATAITGQLYGPWRNVSSTINGNNLGVLPLDLISFNAAWLQTGKTVNINFKTEKESGVCCFDIQKSHDGLSFSSIGTLPAKNISGVQSYFFVDINATAKKQYYRLKTINIDGKIEYSNIQQLQHNKVAEILVFPNPTTDILQLQLKKNYSSMHVQIVNAAGQVVKQYSKLIIQNQTVQIPVKELASGSYWLQLQGDGEKQVLQFVKQ
jgi:hypothetical protein